MSVKHCWAPTSFYLHNTESQASVAFGETPCFCTEASPADTAQWGPLLGIIGYYIQQRVMRFKLVEGGQRRFVSVSSLVCVFFDNGYVWPTFKINRSFIVLRTMSDVTQIWQFYTRHFHLLKKERKKETVSRASKCGVNYYYILWILWNIIIMLGSI